MSMSCGPSTAAVKADNLNKLGVLVAESRPWYEALGMTAQTASGILGEDGDDYVSEQGSGLGRKAAELLFSAADVDALKPVCVVFKALFDAVKGAATNRDDLIDLIDYGVLIVKSIPETAGTSGLSPAVKHALEVFGAEVESVVKLASRFGVEQQPKMRRRFGIVKRRIPEVVNHAEINRVIQGHVTKFDRIVTIIGAGAAVQSVQEAKAVLAVGKAAARTQRSIAAVFGAVFVVVAAVIIHMISGLRPLPSSDMAAVPAGGLAVFGAVFFVFAAVIFHMISGLRPPPLPDMAAVPAGALVLPHSYVERAAVQELANGLLSQKELHTPYTVVGMGGGGKTVLASAVVDKSSVREHFRGGIFWIKVGRGAKNSLLPLLQGLAREMGAAPTDTPHGVPHVLDSLEKVQQHLGAVASSGSSPRLVVLDDVWEREVVDALLPLGLKVLVTTRDRSVVGVPTGCLELGGMTEEESLELLLKTSRAVGQPGDAVRTQMTKVVALCGRLPLVLAIAGSMAVVKGKGLTAGAWKVLIEDLKDVSEKMRGRGEQSTSLKVVLETSLDALTRRKQDSLFKLAVLAPGAGAPIDMLLNLWEMQEVDDTREEADGLVSKCLLQDVGGGGYRVHDLVLEFLKDNIKTAVVEKATTLQAHFLGRLDVLKGYESQDDGAGNQGLFVLDALWRSVEHLSGDPKLEVVSYTTSLGELESCEATKVVANSYASVGFLFNIQGKYSEAEPLYARCQAIEEKVLGPEHPSLATTLKNRAGLLKKQGKYAEAEPLYERCQAIEEKILGPEHPSLATTFNNRAELLRQQGKYDEAGPLYERSQAIREKVLGPEHPDVAESLNNRAELLRAQGNYAEAVPLNERATEIWIKALGPEHPTMATALNNRAGLLESQGKYDEAQRLYVRAMAIDEKVYGPDHPEVASDLNNRAALLKSQGKLPEAEPLYKRTQEIFEKSLGRDHPNVATILNNRAVLLYEQGKYDEAETLYVRAIAIGEKVLGPEHPDLAVSLHNRAGLLRQQGKYDEAGPLYLRAIEIGEKTLGPDHPDLATRLNNRAVLLEEQGKYDEAGPLYERSLAIREKVYGPDHPAVATALNNRAGLLEKQGKYDEAGPLYERSQAIREKVLGPEHPDVAESLNDRAGLLRAQGKFAEAEPLYERATEIWEKALGRDHPTVATVLNHRAELLRDKGKYDEAGPLYERSLAIREKVYGPDHPAVATALNNRALLLQSQGKYDEADPLYVRVLQILAATVGVEHPYYASTLNNRAVLLYAKENYTEAIPLLERALEVRTEKLGKKHPDTVSTRNNLEAVRKKE